jgi:tRNA1Val (adenine37-N6)-methyltransferase
MDRFTTDTLINGSLSVIQSRGGYRFSMDPILLCAFAPPGEGQRVLDLGTGCGIIPLVMARRSAARHLIGVEIQPELADIARTNVTRNRLEERVTILCMDMKGLTRKAAGGSVDLVVANPPYTPAGSGRQNPDSQRAVARHEIAITLPALLSTAAAMLDRGGRFAVCYPPGRMVDLLEGMKAAALAPRSLQAVHPFAEKGADIVLVEGVKGGKEPLTIMPPLVVYDSPGVYTEAAARIFDS